MTDKHAEVTEYHPIFVVLLVVVESIFTLMLRIDRHLKALVQPLIANHTVIKVILTKPHIIFYASFTERGVLLDFAPTELEPIAGTLTLPSLFRLDMFFSEERLLANIYTEGDQAVLDIIKKTFVHLSIAHILNVWFAVDQIREKLSMFGQQVKDNYLSKVRRESKSSNTNTEENPHIPTLILKVNEQQRLLDAKAVEIKEKEYEIRRMKRQLRHRNILSIVLAFVLMVMCATLLMSK